MIGKWDIDYIYIDSAAQQTRFDFAQQYDISTINAKKSVLDGISHVAAIVDNNRLMVDQKCLETLASLDQYQWDPNPNLAKEKPKHNRASHMADALRYALYSFQTSNSGF
jgi:phage terminase large subunit